MILSCNSCGKKFVVPDQAITSTGRMVQCGSCGNKWKQFPVKSEITENVVSRVKTPKKVSNVTKTPKQKKNRIKKSREINLYSPEYLAKKHGITLSKETKVSPVAKNVSFGFYNSLILFLVLLITLSKLLHFFQDFIIFKFPFTEFYINYFFESLSNMFEIWKNLISSY